MIDPNDIHSDDDMDITTPSTTPTSTPSPTPTPTKKNKKKQQPKNKNQNRMPFLDTFYSLSCDDQQERSYAAYSLIQHIFLSTSSSSSQEQGEALFLTKEELLSRVKDGTYAFQRLLNGLNSGRESSRQGFGACLSLFLKYSLTIVPFVKEGDDDDDDDDDDDENKQNDKCFMELFREYNDTHPTTKGSAPVIPTTTTSTNETKETIYHYIYTKIVAATTSTTSSETNLSKNMKKKKKGSEDRDYQFGLLFGICSMIRSGMIMDCGIEVCF